MDHTCSPDRFIVRSRVRISICLLAVLGGPLSHPHSPPLLVPRRRRAQGGCCVEVTWSLRAEQRDSFTRGLNRGLSPKLNYEYSSRNNIVVLVALSFIERRRRRRRRRCLSFPRLVKGKWRLPSPTFILVQTLCNVMGAVAPKKFTARRRQLGV